MNNKSEKEQREVAIAELLKKESKISVQELSERFGVSGMTIRRDLEILRKNHVIERTHGFASLVQGGEEYAIDGEIYDLRTARIQNLNIKNQIACYAAKLIQPNDLIFFDSGTTVSRITNFLPTDFEFSALCYNFTVLAELLKHPNIKTIFPGGYYYPEDQIFTSSEAVNTIRHFRANIAFVSASGIHKSLGITCINGHSADNKRAIIESSAKTILLTDSTKFDLVKSNHFAELSEINTIITDNGISEKWLKYLNSNKIEIIAV